MSFLSTCGWEAAEAASWSALSASPTYCEPGTLVVLAGLCSSPFALCVGLFSSSVALCVGLLSSSFALRVGLFSSSPSDPMHSGQETHYRWEPRQVKSATFSYRAKMALA